MLENGRYLNLNNVDLNYSLREIYLHDTETFIDIIMFLKDSERYELDYLFSLILDIHEIAYYTNVGEIKKYQESLDSLLFKLENEGYFESITICINILANAYTVLSKIEETIRCYIWVIDLEKEHNKVGLNSAIAFHNIGQVYAAHQNIEKTLEYTIKANSIISKLPTGNREYDSFWIFNVCELATLYFDLEELDKGLYYYDLAKRNKPDFLSSYSDATFHKLEMQLNYIYGNLEKINLEYEKLSEYLVNDNNFDALISYTVFYYEYYSKLAGITEELIHKMELALQFTSGRGSYKDELIILTAVIDYYLKNNENNKARPYIKRLYSQVNDYYEQNKKETMKMMDISHEKYIYAEGLAREQNKQKQLQSYYEENEKKNSEIKELNKRLSVIRNICKDIAISAEYDSLFYKLYHRIKDLITIDNFTIMSFDEEDKVLKTKINYDENKKNLYSEVKLGADTPLLLKLLKNKETLIYSNKEENAGLLKELAINQGNYHSAIISPMIFKGKPIALAYVLSSEENAYSQIPKEFVIQVSIYMSIVISNIKRKNRLVKIIEENKKTKKDLEQANVRLKDLSEKDSLTGINNRLAFYNFYNEKLQIAKAKNKIVSLYMIDIDYFKKYNDYYGHIEGDNALKNIAKLLSEHFNKEGEILARFGGEEFIAFSMNDNFDETYHMAESLREKVEQLNIEHKKSEYNVLTVSIGVASFKELTMNEDSYIAAADKALYEAKSSGRNKLVHYTK